MKNKTRSIKNKVLALAGMLFALSLFAYGSSTPEEKLAFETCGVTDVTAAVTNHLAEEYSAANLKITELGDAQKRYYSIAVDHLSTNERVWKLFDLGSDKQLGTADDAMYEGDSLQNIGYFIGEMSTSVNSEKLWYVKRSTNDEIWSCDLPGCTNKVQEVTLQSTVQGILPSLLQDRIYIIKETPTWHLHIVSCSRNAQHPDYCGRAENVFRLEYAAPIPERTILLKTIQDTGIMLYDTQATYKYKWYPIHASSPRLMDINSITQINHYLATRFTNTGFLMFDGTRAYYQIHVIIFEGQNGKTHYIEQLPKDTQGVLIGLDKHSNRIKYVYRTDAADSVKTYIKEIGGTEKLIEEGSLYEKFFMLDDGTILAVNTNTKLNRFDCTP